MNAAGQRTCLRGTSAALKGFLFLPPFGISASLKLFLLSYIVICFTICGALLESVTPGWSVEEKMEGKALQRQINIPFMNKYRSVSVYCDAERGFQG